MKSILYQYNGQTYETPPIKHYYIEMEEMNGAITYISIHRMIPNYVHTILIIFLLVPLIILNYFSFKIKNIQIKDHTLRVPSEMYYDNRTKVLDLDITNDSSNFEVISFTIESPTGEVILELNGINPGESVGSIPIEFKFDSLPVRCILIYKATCNGFVFREIYKDILVVDRRVADNDINHDF